MKKSTARCWALHSALFIGLGLASSTFASGTLSPGGGGDQFANGRRIYIQKIACSSCPVSDGVADKSGAIALVERIDADEFSLSPRERSAVVKYLNRRWRLR